jgi:23S rRNA-/tRNA-specific pseudouridylate synthase
MMKPPKATCRAYLLKDAKAAHVTIHDSAVPGARPIVTAYETLEQGAVSRVEIHLITGRTHQIRVHMKSIGHPVCGDPIYGSGRGAKVPRLMLHAYTLAFTHPRTGERMTFTAPLPEEFVQGLRGNGVEWEK